MLNNNNDDITTTSDSGVYDGHGKTPTQNPNYKSNYRIPSTIAKISNQTTTTTTIATQQQQQCSANDKEFHMHKELHS